jgi:hypothetical protein
MKAIILLTGCYLLGFSGNSQTLAGNRTSTLDSTVVLNDNYYNTHFLWFAGHWNDQKNVFATTSFTDTDLDSITAIGGGGINLTVSPQGTVRIDSKNVDLWNKKIEDGLTILKKAEDELKSPSADAKEWGHHFNEVTLPVLDDIREEWKGNKIDSKKLLSQNENQNQKDIQSQQTENKFISSLTNWCQNLKPEYDKILAFYQAHRHDKESNLSYPPPPAYSNKCIACDTSLEKLYHIQDSVYTEKFFTPESDMIRTCFGILRNLSLIGRGEGSGTWAEPGMEDKIELAFHFSKDPSTAGPCSYLNSYDLNKVIEFLALRMYHKAVKLFKDYSKNVETARPVIKTLLMATRNAELLGLKVDEDGNLAECAGLISRVLEYYFDQRLLQEHDWSQLANIPFLFGLERMRQLLGAKESDFVERMGKLLNSFHLNIDMDIKIGKENKAYQITHLTGKTKIAPEFDFVNDTCYRWVAVEDKPNQLGFPVKKSSQKIECDLITNEFVAPGPRPVYAGTKNYYALLYGLKMDYCHPGKDTILLSSFIPEPNPNAGIWQIPMSPPQAMGTWQIEHMFQDVSTMKELALSGKAKQQAETMKQQGEQIAAQMKSIQAQMSNKKGMPNLDQLHKIQDLAAKAMNLGNNENVAPILSIDFPLEIKNNTTTLQDKRYDAKEINPEESSAIIYGYYTVKVVYESQK